MRATLCNTTIHYLTTILSEKNHDMHERMQVFDSLLAVRLRHSLATDLLMADQQHKWFTPLPALQTIWACADALLEFFLAVKLRHNVMLLLRYRRHSNISSGSRPHLLCRQNEGDADAHFEILLAVKSRQVTGEIIMTKLQTAQQHLKWLMSSPALQTRWGGVDAHLEILLAVKVRYHVTSEIWVKS